MPCRPASPAQTLRASAGEQPGLGHGQHGVGKAGRAQDHQSGVERTDPPQPLDLVESPLGSGGPPPAGLSADEQRAWDQLALFYKNGLGYANEMANRPQTLYAIQDSPVGLAAWMLDHDAASLAMIVRVFDGQSEGLTRDDILDNVTLYRRTR